MVGRCNSYTAAHTPITQPKGDMPELDATLPYPATAPDGQGWLIQFSYPDVIRLAGRPSTTQLGYWNRYGAYQPALAECQNYVSQPCVMLWAAGGADVSGLTARFRQHVPRSLEPTLWAAFIANSHLHGFYLIDDSRYQPAVCLSPGVQARAIPGSEERGFLASLTAAKIWLADNEAPATATPWVFFNAAIGRVSDCYLTVSSPETDSETRTGLSQYIPSNITTKVANTHPLLHSNTGTRTCGRCGEVGHNVRTCDNHHQLWDKMGIEVEGRFFNLQSKRDLARALTGEEGTPDGSLRAGNSDADCWEFRTRPGKLASAMTQLHALYPDETGPDCGMHIHVSFSTADIALLYNTDFFAYFRAEWKAWGEANSVHRDGEFWKRLNGQNNYCRQNVSATGNVLSNGGTGDRYHQLNFSAWDEHKTVECRLLPMFKSEALALSACKKLISIYETWLSMDHTVRLPEVDVDLPAYALGAEEFNSEVETSEIRFTVDTEIAVTEIPAAAPGMMRVVIPAGRIQSPDMAGTHRAAGVADFVTSLDAVTHALAA